MHIICDPKLIDFEFKLLFAALSNLSCKLRFPMSRVLFMPCHIIVLGSNFLEILAFYMTDSTPKMVCQSKWGRLKSSKITFSECLS